MEFCIQRSMVAKNQKQQDQHSFSLAKFWGNLHLHTKHRSSCTNSKHLKTSHIASCWPTLKSSRWNSFLSGTIPTKDVACVCFIAWILQSRWLFSFSWLESRDMAMLYTLPWAQTQRLCSLDNQEFAVNSCFTDFVTCTCIWWLYFRRLSFHINSVRPKILLEPAISYGLMDIH